MIKKNNKITHVCTSKPIKLTAVYVKKQKYYIGFLLEVPGVAVQKKTLALARKAMASGLKEILASHKKLRCHYLTDWAAEKTVVEPLGEVRLMSVQ